MISLFIGLVILFAMLWLGYKVTGVLIMAFIWLFIKLPIAVVLFALALVCCCTIILIPVAGSLFKTSVKLAVPGV